jgi:hypothetical protein
MIATSLNLEFRVAWPRRRGHEIERASAGHGRMATKTWPCHPTHSWLGILAWWTLLAASLSGCNGWKGQEAVPGYLPEWGEARQALESALAAWRDAPSPLPASFDTQAVIFVDKQRRPGQRLLSFTVLGQSDVENARQFTVRIQLEAEESPRLVRYNVLGRNPAWVFRLEDYEMISHWEHDMTDPAPTPERAKD